MPHEHFHRFFEAVHHYGYAAIFVLIFVENFGIPVPGETIFIAALLMVAKRELSLVPVVLCAWLASVLGGMVGFLIGRYGGHKLLEKYGRYIGMNAARLKKTEAFFARYGGTVTLFARFFDGVRQIYAILAGSINPDWQRFLLFNILGAALWVGVWSGLVLYFGRHLRVLWELFKKHEIPTLLGIAAAALVVAATLAWWRRRKSTTPGPVI